MKTETNGRTNEKFFRMLSIAFLGALALACVPDSGATSSTPALADLTQVVPVEIQAMSEVTEINAGRFNPAVAGDVVDEAKILSLTQAEASLEKRFDPNY